MWSHGAVVIKTYGDPNMANTLTEGLNYKLVPVHEYEAMKRDNYFLKKRNREEIMNDIIDAQIKYGYNRVPGRIERVVVIGLAMISYGASSIKEKLRRRLE